MAIGRDQVETCFRRIAPGRFRESSRHLLGGREDGRQPESGLGDRNAQIALDLAKAKCVKTFGESGLWPS